MAKNLKIVEAEVRRARTATNRTLPSAKADLDLYAPGAKPLNVTLRPAFEVGQAVVIVDKKAYGRLAANAKTSGQKIAKLEKQLKAAKAALKTTAKPVPAPVED